MEQNPQTGVISIYKLTHDSWNGRRLADFNLPRVIGHYITYRLAIEARSRHILRQHNDPNPENYTTEDDYTVSPIYVHTRNPK